MVVDPWLRAMEPDVEWEGIPLSNLSYAKVMAFADDTVLGLASVSDLRRAEFWIDLETKSVANSKKPPEHLPHPNLPFPSRMERPRWRAGSPASGS